MPSLNTSSLHGSWRPFRAELDGEHAPALALTHMELEFTASTYAIRYAGQIYDAGRYLTAETGLVLLCEEGEHAGRVVAAIYQQSGDRLRVCFGLDGQPPSGFATAPGSHRYLVTYRRSPPAPSVVQT